MLVPPVRVGRSLLTHVFSAPRSCTMDILVLFNLFCLLQMSLVSFTLPIVDPGLFVIMGVGSCRSGDGYCMLGLDCTLDEDFLPDDEGGHCDGLRSAFTPSAHFICCRYNVVNKTEANLPHIGESPDITPMFSEQLSTLTSPLEIQTTTVEQTSDIPTSTLVTVTEVTENQPVQARIEPDDFTSNLISNKNLNKVTAEIEIRVNDKKNQSRERDVDDSDERVAIEMRTEVSVSVGTVTKTISRRDATTRMSVSDIFSSTVPSDTNSQTQNIQSSKADSTVVSEKTQEELSDTSSPTIFDTQSTMSIKSDSTDEEATHTPSSGNEIVVNQSYPFIDLDNSLIPVTTQKTELTPENKKSNIDNDVIGTKEENEISKKASADQMHNKNFPKDVSRKNNDTKKIGEDIKTSYESNSQPVGNVSSAENRFTTSREHISSFLPVSEDITSTTARNRISSTENREEVDDHKVNYASSSSEQGVHTQVTPENITDFSKVPTTILETETENLLRTTQEIFSEQTNFEEDNGNTIPTSHPTSTTENSTSIISSDKIGERHKDTSLQDATYEKQQNTAPPYHTSTGNTTTESYGSATSLDTTQKSDIHTIYFTSTEMDGSTTSLDTNKKDGSLTSSPAFIERRGVTIPDTAVKSSLISSDTTRELYSSTTKMSHTGIEVDRSVMPTNAATVTATTARHENTTIAKIQGNTATTASKYKNTATTTERPENTTTAKIQGNTATTTSKYKNTATTTERLENTTTAKIQGNTAKTTSKYKNTATTTERPENTTTAKVQGNIARTTSKYRNTATTAQRHENTAILDTTKPFDGSITLSDVTTKVFLTTTTETQLSTANTIKKLGSMTSTENHGSAALTDAIGRNGILNSDIAAETDGTTMIDTTTESYETSSDTTSGITSSNKTTEKPNITVSSDETTDIPIYTTYSERTTEKPKMTVSPHETSEKPMYMLEKTTEKPKTTVYPYKTSEKLIYTTEKITEKPKMTVSPHKTSDKPIYTSEKTTEKPKMTIYPYKTSEKPIYTTEKTTENSKMTVYPYKTSEKPIYTTEKTTENPKMTVYPYKTSEKPIYTTEKTTEKPKMTIYPYKTSEKPIYTTEKTTEKPKMTSYKTTERHITTIFSDKTTQSPSNTSSGKLTESHGTTIEIPRSETTETLCGKTSSQNNNCWMVGFMNTEADNNLMCVGSYLDSKTIISSANCLSRIFDMGVSKVALSNADDAVTSSEMIHDVVIHEEYRNKGVQVLLNDIGLVRLKPESKLPPGACALCLPSSEEELMDKPCDATEQDGEKHMGSPMVCQGKLLAGIASSYNPGPVYTPISDYLMWIRTNQIIRYDTVDKWK